jgi:hypothetical protein
MNHRALAGLLAGAFTILSLAAPSPSRAQCILAPDSPGQNGQTRLQNFYTLVNNLYAQDFAPTHRVLVNGKQLQAPPWYNSSTDCGVVNLKSGYGVVAPSQDDYLLVSDELSELAVVTALADNDQRMMEIHNTVQALDSTLYPGLPCWIAEVKVSQGSVTCRSQDTASDATVRFGLAYYHAANNPNFPAASRALYRAAGDALAVRHLNVEYAQGCYTSPVTGHPLCEWIGGGGNTASGQVSDLTMWIGYSQDVARFLLAAYESTGNTTYAARAEEVVDQWLIASTFNGIDLTFGRFNYRWNTGVQPIAPQPGDTYFWDQGRAWDAADAPRALWMGDVLRAVNLSTGGAPLTGAYAKLSQWVQLVHANGTQTATTSCIQYNQNGTAVSGNCGTDYYYNGLGAGLHTYHQTPTLDDKLDRALIQYGWTGGKTWNGAQCFGIYRGIRPVKALASAIGLDSTTYGGTACGTSPPAAPSWLRVDTVPSSSTELKLTWQDNSNNETGFKVERKMGCCGPWTLLPNASANPTGTATYSSTGLQCGTSYAYRVWAFNGAGESAKTNEAAGTTNACN